LQVKEALAKKEKLLLDCQQRVMPKLLDEKQALIDRIDDLEAKLKVNEG
jgi:hypothetical protein